MDKKGNPEVKKSRLIIRLTKKIPIALGVLILSPRASRDYIKFVQIFTEKFGFITKNSIFDQNFDFLLKIRSLPEFRFMTQISIFC